MENTIISSEKVRPSSPTPRNLQTFKLSMLDQIVPPTFIHLVLYFPNAVEINDPDILISQTTQQLKLSLSVILTRFYPLAGKVNTDGRSIDCNDEGVPFVAVKFTGQKLSDLLRNPDLNLLRRLLPSEITSDYQQGPDSSVLLIQVNYFDCGGIAIGAFFWHGVIDATTFATFLNSWAAATRGSKEAICPNYIVQSMFPGKEKRPALLGPEQNIMKTGKSIIRRYVFGAGAISSLKSKSGIERPTRVEVVSALIWKCFMAASLVNNTSESVLMHAVNLRRRAQLPFPSVCFGNFLALSATTSSNENENDLGLLVRKMRAAISKIDDDYINRMHGDEGLSGYHENLRRMRSQVPEGADILPITSWCGFGLHSTDFGWGKPIWSSGCRTGSDSMSQFYNLAWLMDTRNGHGIEAWVILDEKYMSVFDNVEELRILASIDPSPLDM